MAKKDKVAEYEWGYAGTRIYMGEPVSIGMVTPTGAPIAVPHIRVYEPVAKEVTPTQVEKALQKSQDWKAHPPTQAEQTKVYMETGYQWNPYAKEWIETTPSIREVAEAAPEPTVTKLPPAPKVPKDIYEPVMDVGIRTVGMLELEEAAKTWEEAELKLGEPSGPAQFGISAVSYPAQTAVGLVETGLWALAKPKELPKRVAKGYYEFGRGLWAREAGAWGGLTGAVLWTGVAPKLIEKYVAPPVKTETAFVSRAKIEMPRGEQISYFKTKAAGVEYPSVSFTKFFIADKETFGLSAIMTALPEERIVPSALVTKGVTFPEKLGFIPFAEKGILFTEPRGLASFFKPYKKLDVGALGVSKRVSEMGDKIASVGISASKIHRGKFAGLTEISFAESLEALPGSTYYATAPPSYVQPPLLTGISGALAEISTPKMPPVVIPPIKLGKEPRVVKRKLEPLITIKEPAVSEFKMDITPRYAVKRKVRERVGLRMRAQPQMQMQKGMQSQMQKMGQSLKQMTGQMTAQKQVQAQMRTQKQLQKQITKQKYAFDFPSPTVVPPPPPPMITFGKPLLPKPYKPKYFRKRKKVKVPRRYRPSIAGITAGKFIKAVPKERLTGLEVRFPVLIKKRKVKKRKVKKKRKRKRKKKR